MKPLTIALAHINTTVGYRAGNTRKVGENIEQARERDVDRNEYKRRQSPPGIKITPRGVGKDRRLPIINRYRNV
jgi:hypothetical protein